MDWNIIHLGYDISNILFLVFRQIRASTLWNYIENTFLLQIEENNLPTKHYHPLRKHHSFSWSQLTPPESPTSSKHNSTSTHSGSHTKQARRAYISRTAQKFAHDPADTAFIDLLSNYGVEEEVATTRNRDSPVVDSSERYPS